MVKSGISPDMYVMICGRATPAQREIIRRRCSINTDHYKVLLGWLIHNHPSYEGLQQPEVCPPPIILGGFDENTNNTDEDTVQENFIDGEEMSYAPKYEQIESTGPYSSEKKLILSYLNGKKQHYFSEMVI